VPGQYVLAGDCMGAGITIMASDVHLKLNRHTMIGAPAFSSPGIHVFKVSHVHIEGPGTITSFNDGIFLSQVSDSHVEQVTCLSNSAVGLELFTQVTNTHVNNNVFSMNHFGLLGQFSSDNHLDNNQAINNAGGIYLLSGATNFHVNGNTALGNSANDLEDDNPNCDDNKWNGNRFLTASQSCIH
jgi:parallel beta-helix repeat protein